MGSTPTTLTDCTISGNKANRGGGFYAFPVGSSGTVSTPQILDTIVAGNTANASGPDAQGVVDSQGYNLIGKTDGSSGWVGSDLRGTIAAPLNADLTPLGDYGGPTQTMALLPGSPAFNAGTTAAGVTTDQRGVTLPKSNPDIGAYQGFDEVVTTTAESGAGSLGQAIDDINGDIGLNVITFSIGTVGSQQTIAVTAGLPAITDPVLIDGWSQGGAGYTGAPLVLIEAANAGGTDRPGSACRSRRLSTIDGLIFGGFTQ